MPNKSIMTVVAGPSNDSDMVTSLNGSDMVTSLNDSDMVTSLNDSDTVTSLNDVMTLPYHYAGWLHQKINEKVIVFTFNYPDISDTPGLFHNMCYSVVVRRLYLAPPLVSSSLKNRRRNTSPFPVHDYNESVYTELGGTQWRRIAGGRVPKCPPVKNTGRQNGRFAPQIFASVSVRSRHNE